jgi:hypothetical protein
MPQGGETIAQPQCSRNLLDSPPPRTAAAAHPPVARPASTRSAVSNGKRLHVEAPGDGAWSRRFRDVLAEIVSDLSGADCLSEGQRQLARRCATIAIACERMEGDVAAGKAIDLDAYGQLTDRLGRAFTRFGLKRVPRDVTPSLADIAAQIEADKRDAA